MNDQESFRNRMEIWIRNKYPGSSISVKLVEVVIPASTRLEVHLSGKTRKDDQIIKKLTTSGVPGPEAFKKMGKSSPEN